MSKEDKLICITTDISSVGIEKVKKVLIKLAYSPETATIKKNKEFTWAEKKTSKLPF